MMHAELHPTPAEKAKVPVLKKQIEHQKEKVASDKNVVMVDKKAAKARATEESKVDV